MAKRAVWRFAARLLSGKRGGAKRARGEPEGRAQRIDLYPHGENCSASHRCGTSGLRCMIIIEDEAAKGLLRRGPAWVISI